VLPRVSSPYSKSSSNIGRISLLVESNFPFLEKKLFLATGSAEKMDAACVKWEDEELWGAKFPKLPSKASLDRL
jgi:hypothetical protein